MFQNPNFNNNMNINQASYQAFHNMLNMNQNYYLNNQINLNNLMMQYMMMNPNFFQMNYNPQNNIQNTAFQPINLDNLNQKYIIQNGGVMPRPNKVNNISNIDSFPGYSGPRINIIFETGTGLKINIPTPINITIQELLIKFAKRVGVSEALLGKKLFFVVNGGTIPANEKNIVKNFFKDYTNNLKDQVKIIVLDASNVIGAHNYSLILKM